MKKLFFAIFITIALAVIAGCSSKFNVGASYKNITVVYGFLDKADTAHYVRIQKAFLTQDLSTISIAQTPDSSYYSNLDVMVKKVNDVSGTFAPGDTIHLNRVDLDLEGYPKEPGTFFTAPNYAYKFKSQLDPNYNYRLVITNLTTGDVDSANAVVIDDESPGVFVVNNAGFYSVDLGAADFADGGGPHNPVFNIDGNYIPANINENNPVTIAQAAVTFNWIDSNIVTMKATPNSYIYNLGNESLSMFSSTGYTPKYISFYEAIFEGMGVAPANIVRILTPGSVSVYASTNDFALYAQAAYTQGTGLTGSEIEPVYTNIMGANVLGLYTSRGTVTKPFTFSTNTIDTLITNPYFAPIKIVGATY